MRWIQFVNITLLAITALCIGSIVLIARSETDYHEVIPVGEKACLPSNPFDQESKIASDETSLFFLNWTPPKMLLPDLRHEVIYQGKNERPDVQADLPIFHILLKGVEESRPVKEGMRLYLLYDGKYSERFLEQTQFTEKMNTSGQPIWGEIASSEGHYSFSPNNAPSSLWLEVIAQGEQVKVTVNMLDDQGDRIQSPVQYKEFCLNHQKRRQAPWELGKYRVDSSLLIRQKARWVGSDRFLELHGGDDFAFTTDKQRIDFADQYSCFVGVNSYLVWKEGQWQTPKESENTIGSPLIRVKKITDKMMSLDLWDAEGLSKTSLNLVCAKERTSNSSEFEDLNFVGAKTWGQFLVESHGARFTCRPNDWLVYTDEGWSKLDSPEAIDEYVERKTVGPLLVLEKLKKKNGRQYLVGHVFNATRTQVEAVELGAKNTATLANGPVKEGMPQQVILAKSAPKNMGFKR